MRKEDYVYTPRSLSLDTVLGPEAAGNEPKVRLAIVGAGSMAAEHIETAMSVGKAEVVGIYDPYRPSIDYTLQFVDKPDVVKIYNSVQEVGEDDNVDAIIIASPNYLYLDNLRELLPFNKHILCEKPMTSTLKDALEVVELPENISKTGTHSGSTYYEHLNFINAIQGRLDLSVSAEEGMRAIAIGAAAELSVKTGEPVYIEDLIASCR